MLNAQEDRLPMRNYLVCCPKCGQVKTPQNGPIIRYSSIRLELPYFMCGECRLIYVDKIILRREISIWRKRSPSTKSIRYEELCKEMAETLNEIIEYYCQNIGYRRAKFKKIYA